MASVGRSSRMMKGKFNKREFRTGLVIGLVGIPLALALIYAGRNAYDAYRGRQLSLTVTGPVRVWEHHDLHHHQGSRVIAVLEKGAEVKVLRTLSGIDWASIRVKLADGREGYVDAFGTERENYILR